MGLLTVAAAILFAFAALPAWSQTYGAQITQFSTDKFLVFNWQPVTLKVKNFGLSEKITVRAVSAPSWWGVRAGDGSQTPQVTHFIAQGSTEKFEFQVMAHTNSPSGTIGWEVWTLTVEDYPLLVYETDFPAQAVYPPAPFHLLSPYTEQTNVDLSPNFQWETSTGADSYVLELFRDYHGAPETQPFFQSDPMLATSLQYAGLLEYANRYWWQVTATNVYAQSVNLDEFTLFVTKPVPQLSSFYITWPLPDERYDTLPQVYWGPSANAVYYTVRVYDDVNGGPAESPVANEQRVVTTTWNWTNFPPLTKGRKYWLEVEATGQEDGAGVYLTEPASNAPLPFYYSGLDPFFLNTPVDNTFRVGLQPYFQWEVSPRSNGYRIEIRGAEAVNAGFRFSDTTTDYFYQYEGPLLLPGAWYEWTVYALGNDEELMAANGYNAFNVLDIQPFLLKSPAYGATGVLRTPRLEWYPVAGRDALQLVVEIWAWDEFNPNRFYKLWATDPPLKRTVTSQEVPHSLLTPGYTYYWRVFARYQENLGRYNEGDLRPFQVTSLGDFVLMQPGDLFSNLPTTPTFSWQPAENANRYSLALWLTDDAKNPKGLPITHVMNIPGSEYVYDGSVTLTGDTTFAWQVFAWQGSTWVASSSPLYRFTTRHVPTWYGVGVKEYILGQGFPNSEEAASDADAWNRDGFIDVADLISWINYNYEHPPPR